MIRRACLYPIGLALVLAASPASAQWAPIHSGTDRPPPPPPSESAQTTPSSSSSTAPVSHPFLIPSVVAGWWGLDATEGSGYDSSFLLGARAELDPIAWLPVELWAFYGSRARGTNVVSTASSYISMMGLVGWQYRHGMGVYGVGVGAAATVEWITHSVTDGGTQVVGATGLTFGPAWDLTMKLRIGVVELRGDVASVWRGAQADLLLVAGVGLCLPPAGR